MRWRIAVAATLTLLFAVWRGGVGDPVSDAAERWLLDVRFKLRGAWETVEHVAVVTIDEAAAARFPSAAERRNAIAEAVGKIFEDGAKVVAVDIIFAESTPADRALAAALAEGDKVVIGVAAGATAQLGDLSSPDIDAALGKSAIPVVVGARGPPQPSILPTPGIASAAWLGHANFSRATNGVLYAAPAALTVSEAFVLPALALKAAALFMDERITLHHGGAVTIGERVIPLDGHDRIYIDHLGPPGAAPTHGLLSVLDGDAPPGAFTGRIVFIGGSGGSLGDAFATPFAPNVPGVEVNAGLAAGVLSGRWLSRNPALIALSGLAAMLLCLGAALSARLPSARAFVLGLAAMWGVGLAATQIAFSGWGLWLDGATILAGLFAGSLAGAAEGFAAQSRRSARLSRERANLARFLAPGLARMLAREGGSGFDRRSQDVAVLFVDVEGFTRLAEAAPTDEVTDYLERLHAHFEAASAAFDATITDFQGDGAMLVFGLPEAQDDDARRALDCAVWLAGEPPPRFGGDDAATPRPRLRVAVHQGAVTAAVLGGAHQSVVTVAGDTVNLAHRLQEVAKELGAQIVTTRETLAAAFRGADDWPGWRRHSRRQIRGRAQSAEVWVRATAARALQTPPPAT